jgi:hypothetical protein
MNKYTYYFYTRLIYDATLSLREKNVAGQWRVRAPSNLHAPSFTLQNVQFMACCAAHQKISSLAASATVGNCVFATYLNVSTKKIITIYNDKILRISNFKQGLEKTCRQNLRFSSKTTRLFDGKYVHDWRSKS